MSTKPKYFVGNWVRCKEDGWTGIILAVETTHKKDILYKIGHFFEPEAYFGEHYWESEITELFEVIPYPWQEFFKVGDKVQTETDGIGKIVDNTHKECGNACIFVHFGNDTEDYYRLFDPHELIKVG